MVVGVGAVEVAVWVQIGVEAMGEGVEPVAIATETGGMARGV